MASLGSCPLCSGTVSTDADRCPHCGTSDFTNHTEEWADHCVNCMDCQGRGFLVYEWCPASPHYWYRSICPKCHGTGGVQSVVVKTIDRRTNSVVHSSKGHWRGCRIHSRKANVEGGKYASREAALATTSSPITTSDGCFPAGTLIATPSGGIDIASMKVGDLVLAFDPRRSVLRSRRILDVRKHEKNTIWEMVFTDGNRLRTTASHSFCVSGTWKQARHIVASDCLNSIHASGRITTRQVASSFSTTEVEEVFNLIVDGDFSFVADGVMAHSFTHFRLLRMVGSTIYTTFQGWIRAEQTVERERRATSDLKHVFWPPPR